MRLLCFLILFVPSLLCAQVNWGYADLHNHMMAEYSFGGAWLWGSHTGPEAEAMGSCLDHSHAMTRIPFINKLIGKIKNGKSDTGRHKKLSLGYPNYEHWPRWNSIAHQQMWEGHLKKAYRDGMSVMFLSIMNFEPLCKLMKKKNIKYSCKDKDSILLQIKKIREFEKKHNWFRIVHSSEELAKVVKQRKLAVILAVEMSDVLNDENWRKDLEFYYQKGIRSFQIIHQLNNQFAGAATHSKIFYLFQKLRGEKFKFDKNGKNIKGLSSEGKELIKELIHKGMIIDFAHMGEKSFWQSHEYIKENFPSYPIFLSHGHVRELMMPKKAKQEKTSPTNILTAIKKSKGMFGLRTGYEKVKDYNQSIPNDCDGSSKSLAQSISYLKDKEIPFAFATDFNGFTAQTRPRLGSEKETCGAAPSRREKFEQQKKQKTKLNKSKKTQNRFSHAGLGDISQLQPLISDLESFGLNLSDLKNSSYQVFKMWARAESASKH